MKVDIGRRYKATMQSHMRKEYTHIMSNVQDILSIPLSYSPSYNGTKG